MEKGKIRKHEGFQTSSEKYIESMDKDEHYKYLGILQSTVIDNSKMKGQIPDNQIHIKIDKNT
jgi:hypothetical protein